MLSLCGGLHLVLPCLFTRLHSGTEKNVTAPRRKRELTNDCMAPPNFFTRRFYLFIYLFKFISLLFLFYSPVKCSIYNCMKPGRYVIGEIITINMCNLKKLINKKNTTTRSPNICLIRFKRFKSIN